MPRLYHGTLKTLELGATLQTPAQRSIDAAVVPGAEHFIEQLRPPDRHSRLTSHFATLLPEQALLVQSGMHKNVPVDDIRVYEVEAEDSTKCPMMLFQLVHRLLAEGQTDLARSVGEIYWNAPGDWYFWEVLSPEVLVIKEVSFDQPRKELIDQADKRYKEDVPRSVQVVRQLRK